LRFWDEKLMWKPNVVGAPVSFDKKNGRFWCLPCWCDSLACVRACRPFHYPWFTRTQREGEKTREKKSLEACSCYVFLSFWKLRLRDARPDVEWSDQIRVSVDVLAFLQPLPRRLDHGRICMKFSNRHRQMTFDRWSSGAGNCFDC
jgi:hypothetical protein